MRLLSLKYKKTYFFSAACVTISAILLLLSRYAEGFAQWYAASIYPVFQELIGRIFSFWNHSFFEAGIILFFLLTAAMILSVILILLLRNSARTKPLSFFLRFMLCTVSGLVLVYTMTGAVNYHRSSIGTVLNLPVKEPSKEDLIKLSMILAEDLTELTDDPEWDYSLLTLYDAAYIEAHSVNAMRKLGKTEPSLAGYYSKPKPVYFSNLLTSLGIDGIFSPFTMEANYNNQITPFLIPYTICHELAHFKGYMKEDDAGFIAFLACRNSPSKVFQYSGLFHALIFTLDALKSEAGVVEYNEIYHKLPEPVRFQLHYVMEQSQQQDSSVASVARSVNDVYLKVNAQSGMMSYGRIVDLLAADYADRIDEENLL